MFLNLKRIGTEQRKKAAPSYLMDITLFRDKSPGLNSEHVSLQDPVLFLQLSQQLFHVFFQEIQLLLQNRE
jgi:hypothetical protein